MLLRLLVLVERTSDPIDQQPLNSLRRSGWMLGVCREGERASEYLSFTSVLNEKSFRLSVPTTAMTALITTMTGNKTNVQGEAGGMWWRGRRRRMWVGEYNGKHTSHNVH